MKTDRGLTQITKETSAEKIKPGTELDTIIAVNVLRFNPVGCKNPSGSFAWQREDELLFYKFFKPSSDIHSAMTAITLSQDQFKSKGLRVVLSSVESGKWSVSASITISAHEKEFFNERCTFEKLPLMICYCLVEMYLDYGPKDYETYGWLIGHRKRRPPRTAF
jgi:hypothetical protein